MSIWIPGREFLRRSQHELHSWPKAVVQVHHWKPDDNQSYTSGEYGYQVQSKNEFWRYIKQLESPGVWFEIAFMHPCCQGIVEDLHWEHIGLSPSQFTRTTIYEMRLTVFNKNPTCIISGASSWMWVIGDHSGEPEDEMNFFVKVRVATSVIGSPSWTFCGSTRPLTLHAPETLSCNSIITGRVFTLETP